MIMKYNPGLLCKVQCDTLSNPDKIIYQRYFVSFGVQRNAFLSGCRSYIGIDGFPLKGEYGGILLVAVGFDVNNGIVPLVIVVYEIENEDTWG